MLVDIYLKKEDVSGNTYFKQVTIIDPSTIETNRLSPEKFLFVSDGRDKVAIALDTIQYILLL